MRQNFGVGRVVVAVERTVVDAEAVCPEMKNSFDWRGTARGSRVRVLYYFGRRVIAAKGAGGAAEICGCSGWRSGRVGGTRQISRKSFSIVPKMLGDK